MTTELLDHTRVNKLVITANRPFTPDLKAAYLKLLQESHGIRSEAAQRLGVSYTTIYEHLRRDAEFAYQTSIIESACADQLARPLWNRAQTHSDRAAIHLQKCFEKSRWGADSPSTNVAIVFDMKSRRNTPSQYQTPSAATMSSTDVQRDNASTLPSTLREGLPASATEPATDGIGSSTATVSASVKGYRVLPTLAQGRSVSGQTGEGSGLLKIRGNSNHSHPLPNFSQNPSTPQSSAPQSPAQSQGRDQSQDQIPKTFVQRHRRTKASQRWFKRRRHMECKVHPGICHYKPCLGKGQKVLPGKRRSQPVTVKELEANEGGGHAD